MEPRVTPGPAPRGAVRRLSVEPLVAAGGGAASAEDLAITLHGAAWAKVREHAESDPGCEVGGLLLGRPYSDDAGRAHVVIREVLPASETVAGAASIVFTHETWRRLLERKAELGAGEIVGWYHSHPGFGVFLSSFDVFLHRSFFPQRWHLALVIDPVGCSAAFFLTTPGAVVRRDDFNVRPGGDELWRGSPSDSPPRLAAAAAGGASTRT